MIELDGADATAFAQAQFMNDVAALEPGGWQWNGWLTPKGRVIALFALLRIAPGTLWMLVPDADIGPLSDALRRFVFRSKVAIRPRPGLVATASFAKPVQASGATLAVLDGGTVELDAGTPSRPRALRLSSQSDHGPVDAELEAAWAAADLEHGLPRLPSSQAEQWTPQQLSLERLDAFSVRKGCYPGQEIVARTHFLGKAKRGLVLLESAAALPVGAQVTNGTDALGSVVASAATPSRGLALAVVPLDRQQPAAQVDGIDVREAPLLDGLQR
ncbi:YgfZ/GcvT domain-containing protein [Lysobacter korlensis]|uniref:YgfZ/GcvT domain-containing protein n=1 Tax=Lysobacter korlensis TaxID=553636 RepID=A0ABV6RL65_9GAMM